MNVQKLMNVQSALNYAKQTLHSDTPLVDAEFLLSYVLKKNFTWLKTWPDYQLTTTEETLFLSLLQRRLQGEPIAYITGERGFWTLQLETNSSTLIPRVETELLVENALAFLEQYDFAKVLDLGTGTGAIALAIQSERCRDSVYACDVNLQAVELTIKNSIKNNLTDVNIFQSHWFQLVTEKSFDLIVSNPPYIAKNDPYLKQGDLNFEPNGALIADDDGLADIILIVEQAHAYLNVGGGLMIEHGFTQGDMVRKIFQQAGFNQIKTVVDLSGHDRVTMGVVGC